MILRAGCWYWRGNWEQHPPRFGRGFANSCQHDQANEQAPQHRSTCVRPSVIAAPMLRAPPITRVLPVVRLLALISAFLPLRSSDRRRRGAQSRDHGMLTRTAA